MLYIWIYTYRYVYTMFSVRCSAICAHCSLIQWMDCVYRLLSMSQHTKKSLLWFRIALAFSNHSAKSWTRYIFCSSFESNIYSVIPILMKLRQMSLKSRTDCDGEEDLKNKTKYFGLGAERMKESLVERMLTVSIPRFTEKLRPFWTFNREHGCKVQKLLFRVFISFGFDRSSKKIQLHCPATTQTFLVSQTQFQINRRNNTIERFRLAASAQTYQVQLLKNQIQMNSIAVWVKTTPLRLGSSEYLLNTSSSMWIFVRLYTYISICSVFKYLLNTDCRPICALIFIDTTGERARILIFLLMRFSFYIFPVSYWLLKCQCMGV